ncbi:MAG: aldo/keto reductase [Oscillospiraceae bacterium]
MQQFFTLSNGVKIPAIGFGTYRTPPGHETEQSVLDAIEAGYKGIDCAAVYANEKSVGSALQKEGTPRQDLFITSKLWNDEKGYQSTLDAFDKTINDLQVDYLDLYLIHWPGVKASRENWQQANSETWRAFEELYSKGKIKSVGVSNFLPHHLEPLMQTATVKPMVNQLEFHPGLMQQEAVRYSKENNILVEAWAPLSAGGIFKNAILLALAEKYQKSVAQVALRWILQQGILPLPKSVTPARIKENLLIFDFELLPEDMQKIDAIEGITGSGLNPDTIDF